MDETSGQVLVEDCIYLFLQNGINAIRLGRNRFGPRRQRKGERHDIAGAKIGFRSGKHIGIFDEGVAKLSDSVGGPTRIMQFEDDIAQMGGEAVPHAQKAGALGVGQTGEQFSRRWFSGKRPRGWGSRYPWPWDIIHDV